MTAEEIVPLTIAAGIVEYDAHGRRFKVHRVNHDTWQLFPADGGRCRWGDLHQIREDVTHTLAVGVLPRSAGPSIY